MTVHVETSWAQWLKSNFSEFVRAKATGFKYKVIDIQYDEQRGINVCVLQVVSSRHTIKKDLSKTILDLDIINNLSQQEVRAITYLATLETLAPKYTIISTELGDEVNGYVMKIRDKHGSTTESIPVSTISRDTKMISEFNPLESHEIGYICGMLDGKKEQEEIKKVINKSE